MKKIFSLVAVAFCFCALTTTLVSCGDDKPEKVNPEQTNNENKDDSNDDDAPAPPQGHDDPSDVPTSIVGKWMGDFAAQPDNPDYLMWRYAHKLIYEFYPENTFVITESACWYDTDPSVAEFDKPSIPAIDPIRPTGAYLGERIAHRIAGTYQLGENNKITITTTKEAWGGDDNFDMQDVTTPYVETFDYTINGNKLKIGDGSVVAVSPHNMIAYGEMIWQGKIEGGSDSAPEGLTKADLIGSWDVWANGSKSNFTFTNDKLTINGNEVDDGGAYTFVDERLFYKFNGEVASMDIEMIHNKTVMLAISIIPASQSYSGEEERQTSFAYRQGAQIPVTKADVQGKWYWESKAGFHGIRAVLKLEGDNFDLIITPWGERHTGTFTYQNGYLHFTTLHSYSSRYDNEEHMNGENPEATVWRDYDDPSVNSGSGVVPDPIDAFIPNGTAAYSTLANLQVEYTKK